VRCPGQEVVCLGRKKDDNIILRLKWVIVAIVTIFAIYSIEAVDELNKRIEFIGQKEREFKLRIISIDNNRKDNFVSFYSSGPTQRKEPIYVF
jgi:hypothetical protein